MEAGGKETNPQSAYMPFGLAGEQYQDPAQANVFRSSLSSLAANSLSAANKEQHPHEYGAPHQS